jgi:protein TonB
MSGRNDPAREILRWTLSGIAILGIHGGVVAAVANLPKIAPAGSPEAAIMLDLSAEAAAPSTEKTDVAISEVNQQQAEKEPEPEEKPVEKEPEPEPEPKKVEQPHKAEIELPQPKPAEKAPPRKKMAALNTRQLTADKESTHAISPNPGMMGRMKADYGVAVSAHLNRYKNVPRGLDEGGTVNLSFTLDRHGRVLSSRITRGSGISELDREALDMLRRAQPFPTPPPELAGVQFPFTVPVRYSVR